MLLLAEACAPTKLASRQQTTVKPMAGNQSAQPSLCGCCLELCSKSLSQAVSVPLSCASPQRNTKLGRQFDRPSRPSCAQCVHGSEENSSSAPDVAQIKAMTLWTICLVGGQLGLVLDCPDAWDKPEPNTHAPPCVLQAGLMVMNGVAVLNNDRFLERSAWPLLLSASLIVRSSHAPLTMHAPVCRRLGLLPNQPG